MPTLQPHSLLQGGKYKILQSLGQGGFGITYLAVQTGLDRKVAIKEFFMKDYCNRDAESTLVTASTVSGNNTVYRYRDKFLKEARNIAKLNHPNIVKIIDVFEENGTAYYVMEYLEGGSLADKVKRMGALDVTTATRYTRQIALALDYIHQRQMNHLDVKPANIMLDADDNAVLIDFGLSKQYDGGGKQTTSTPVGISEGFAPLEQYMLGGVSQFSPETDIYSLGATYFNLLTGTVPPNAYDVNQKSSIITEKLNNKGVTRSAISVINKAMRPVKQDRTKSAKEFIKNLSKPSSGIKFNKKWLCVAVVLVAIVAVVIIFGGGNSTIRASYSNDKLTVNDIGYDFVKVEHGNFTMGLARDQGNSLDWEKPAHQVILTKDYYIGKTEVTQALWKAVMGNNPSNFKGDNLPVEQVTWDDCLEFIKKLNELTGKNFRLPTEAEWEFAARGGNNSKQYQYSGSNSLGDVAWYCNNSGDKELNMNFDNRDLDKVTGNNCKTHEVGQKSPNELGIFDMSGNVWEWCSDKGGNYSSGEQTDPKGAIVGVERMVRGGGWDFDAQFCRSSCRGYRMPNRSINDLGLRLALSE